MSLPWEPVRISGSCEAAGTSLAVVSISANYDDFFNDKGGIYVKGKIFEGALNQYIAENGGVRDGLTEVLTQTCGVRIQGNYSRSDLQKGLRLYAREEYAEFANWWIRSL